MLVDVLYPIYYWKIILYTYYVPVSSRSEQTARSPTPGNIMPNLRDGHQRIKIKGIPWAARWGRNITDRSSQTPRKKGC